MKKTDTPLLLIALALLIPCFFLPLWSITLEAPQYPEGLGLYIRISNITGHHPNDLANINLVNHYIGMQEIVPDSIPELRFMPYIVAFLIVSGIAVVLWFRKWLILWLGLFTLLAIAGLVDFYLWNYDFGHNLNTETAAIKIEGMTYQPPVFGRKQMLNFVTTSLPAAGGISAILSLCLGYAVFFMRIKRGSNAGDDIPAVD